MSTKKLTAVLGTAASLVCSSVLSGAVSNVMSANAASVASDTSDTAYTSSTDGENAVLVDGKTVTLTSPSVTKTGDSDSEDADFSGTNAAVLATNGANLTIEGGSVSSDGSHANAVFSTGSGTSVTVSGTTIETSGNNSGGIMTTGGASMSAEDLTVTTSGNSSAAIRSDRGGGTVTVTGGSYAASGVGSPAIYSTAQISVSDASLTSSQSEGIVIEGANSVSLTDCTLQADNTELNGQAQTYQGIMIYQSMSGDAAEGTASFTAQGGSITNENGALFYVTNTYATISLDGVSISNASSDLLTVAQGPWGTSGENGGALTMTASDQALSGNVTVDSASSLNFELDGSSFEGAVTSEGAVYVSLSDDSTWTLTGDSSVSSLTCDEDAIDLNGYTLLVDGSAYTEGTAMTGEEVFSTSAGSSSSAEVGGQPASEGAPASNESAPAKPDEETENAAAGSTEEAPVSDSEMLQDFIEKAEKNDTEGLLSEILAALQNTDDEDGLYTIDEILRVAETIRQGSSEDVADLSFSDLLALAGNDGMVENGEYSDGTETVSLSDALKILQKAAGGEQAGQAPAGGTPDDGQQQMAPSAQAPDGQGQASAGAPGSGSGPAGMQNK